MTQNLSAEMALVEQLDTAILSINPLTGYGEDAVWRVADKARKAMIAARDALLDADCALKKERDEGARLATLLSATHPPQEGEWVTAYDAGLLSDFGGGNVEWWQDYIRAELGRAHEHYASRIAPPSPPPDLEGKLAAARHAITEHIAHKVTLNALIEKAEAECERLTHELMLATARAAENWDAVTTLTAQLAGLMEGLRELDERIYSLMRNQEEDVKVNGPTHPGLLEPMLGCLRDLKAQSARILASFNSGAE